MNSLVVLDDLTRSEMLVRYWPIETLTFLEGTS